MKTWVQGHLSSSHRSARCRIPILPVKRNLSQSFIAICVEAFQFSVPVDSGFNGVALSESCRGSGDGGSDYDSAWGSPSSELVHCRLSITWDGRICWWGQEARPWIGGILITVKVREARVCRGGRIDLGIGVPGGTCVVIPEVVCHCGFS